MMARLWLYGDDMSPLFLSGGDDDNDVKAWEYGMGRARRAGLFPTTLL